MTTVYELAADLIAVFEGLRLVAYQDGGGVWTIGIGHTKGVKQGDVCTFAQAVAWFQEDASTLFGYVASWVPEKGFPGTACAAAYVSFAYNCGLTSLKHVLAGTADMSEFIHDRHGNVETGLQTRRALEKALVNL